MWYHHYIAAYKVLKNMNYYDIKVVTKLPRTIYFQEIFHKNSQTIHLYFCQYQKYYLKYYHCEFQITWIIFMWGSYPSSLRNISGFTRKRIHIWNNVRRGTWLRTSFINKNVDKIMTFTVSVGPKTQQNGPMLKEIKST